ncbi:MAG: hypothetical protein RMI43_04445 [Candidatus Caldarchaeum sp.]|nr:hypothetical protein [Candidatus Caldarchaeum sp.]MDW8063400.1 hypothetical protein [Candidatus Caldarchaeum sp.]MDW8435717.1 hypothetical protein [Candidatus Caldarchaeum sp.]
MAEASPTERRIKQLEEEIKRIREPLEKTLLDIREMINTAENPFIFLTKSVTSEKPTMEKPVSNEKAAEPPVVQAQKPVADFTEIPAVSNMGQDELDSFISILAAVDLMVLIVGREYLTNLANMLAWKNLIPKSLLDGIKEALEFLSTVDKNNRVEQVRESPSFNDILIVLYMFSLLVKDRKNPLTFLLLTSAGNLKFINRSWGGRQ